MGREGGVIRAAVGEREREGRAVFRDPCGSGSASASRTRCRDRSGRWLW